MANTNKNSKGGGSAGDVYGLIAIAGAVIGLAKPVIDIIDDKRKERAEERQDWIKIPDLLSKSLPMKLEAAIDALEKSGLKVSSSPVELSNIGIKYKDCFDSQVVWSNHKYNELVKPGTMVLIRYVTSAIIEESQRLFDESEKHKAYIALKKADKRAEQREKNKQVVDNIISTVKQKVVAISDKTKQLKGSHGTNNVSEEDEG